MRASFPTAESVKKRLRPLDRVGVAIDAFALKMAAKDPDILFQDGCRGDLDDYDVLDSTGDCAKFFQGFPETYKIYMYVKDDEERTNPICVDRFVFEWDNLYDIMQSEFLVRIE